MRAFILLLASLPCFGAANLTISNVVANADGTTTLTFSPCVSPLSPSSGVTDIIISISQAANNLITESTSVSGCTITITTQANAAQTVPVVKENALYVYASITTGSNLMDASGNTVSATGNSYVQASTNNSTWLSIMGTTFLANGRADASPVSTPIFGSSGGIAGAYWMGPGGCARFNGTGSGGINVLNFDHYTGIGLFVDGSQSGSTTFQGSDNAYSAIPYTGLSGSHLYEVCELGPQAVAGYPIMAAIQLTGSLTFGAQPATKPYFIVLAASEGECFGFGPTTAYPTTDQTSCSWWILARLFGYAEVNAGVAGWPVTANTGATTANCGSCEVVVATAMSASTPYVILSAGTTNFTSYGASSNSPGTLFTATGAGTGTGTVAQTFLLRNLTQCASGVIAGCDAAIWPIGSQRPEFVLLGPGGNDLIDATVPGLDYTTGGTFQADAVTMISNAVSRWNPVNGVIVVDLYYSPGLGGDQSNCPTSAAQYSPWVLSWRGAANYFATNNPTIPTRELTTFTATCSGLVNPTDFQSGGYHLSPSGQAKWAADMLPGLQQIFLPASNGAFIF